jgi:glutaconyl-CoA/methylmalonyl-CoA decarboxylase subunit gamma
VKFKIHLDNTEHEIEIGADGALILDGRTFQSKVNNSSGERRTVQFGDRSHEVRVVENCADTGIFVLELAGERVPITVTDLSKGAAMVQAVASAGAAASAAAPAAGGGANGTGGGGSATSTKAPDQVTNGVWAPVPGKVVDVLVKVGDMVEEGAAVLILEAMKMENELHAPKRGVVAAVLVKKGDQAEKGQLLVAFE